MKYNISIRTLHWVIAVIVIGMLITVENRGLLPDTLRKNYFYWHKYFGVMVLGLMSLRIFFRILTTIPPYPESFSSKEKLAAKIVVKLFYILLICMPLSGIIMTNAAGYTVSMLGYELPMLVQKDKALRSLANEAHELIGNGLIILIGLHVAAVIKHAIVDKENIIKRIW